MVVVVIIGILAALVAPRVLGRVDDARISAARHDIATIGHALKLYKLDNHRFPTTEQGLKALAEEPKGDAKNWRAGGYIEGGVMKDPWDGDYRYLQPGERGGDFDLFSYAADGKPGGEGIDADIGNWK